MASLLGPQQSASSVGIVHPYSPGAGSSAAAPAANRSAAPSLQQETAPIAPTLSLLQPTQPLSFFSALPHPALADLQLIDV
jgi:hypothetical protein